MDSKSTEQLGQLTFALVVTLLILGYITVGLRLWVRLRITKNPGWDDITMIITLLLFTCYCSFILVIQEHTAFGQIPTPDTLRKILLFVQLGEIFYIITTTILKISLGLFFLRILTKQWQINIFRAILVVSAVFGIFYTFIAIFQCGTPDKLLDRLLLGNIQCLPNGLLLSSGYLYGSINVIADWTFVLIPIFVLLESDMDRRSKISVSIVMGLGAVGSISSILRMVYMKGLSLNNQLSTEAVYATIWATAEPGTGIIAASIAILRPLFRKIRSEVQDKLSEHSSARSGSGSGNSTAKSKSKSKNHSWASDEDTIALTLVPTSGSGSSRGFGVSTNISASKRSMDSPTWDSHFDVRNGTATEVVDIKLDVAESRPKPPRKD
ncbi:hypothetical protein K491DRAFT_589900 [Lophiostoma macrostomum CBS 122681]|uniref:Rhodopsin domain-containing protein n=1 Tax=Lophiostoma macrostomum CBS 122681 TaxID=1314788 RepID=A0A6A6TLH6_9PLEO|nr:hypothetical protein K491DRAFT_589900 [Lophiostoma macrostomum CBS 122681]